MAKSKKPRKKYTPKPKVVKVKRLSVEQQIKMIYGDKRPYCKVCGKDAVLASDEEVKAYKQYDTTYQLDFIFGPDCECYKTEDEWMDVR